MSAERRILISAEGKKIGYSVFGHPNFKNPCFYFHGFPGSRLEVGFLDAAATEHNLTIISFDRPGIGPSEFDATRSIAQSVSLIKDFCRTLSIETFSLLAVSGGTPYALAAASLLPSQVRACLIISGVCELASDDAVRLMSPLDRFLIGIAKRFPLIAKIILTLMWWLGRYAPHIFFKFFLASLDRVDQALLDQPRHRQFFSGCIAESFSSPAIGICKDLEVLLSEWNIPLSNIICPVHFIHGGEDTFVPPIMAKINAQHIPNSTVEILDKGAHFVFLTLASKVCSWFDTILNR